jgi:hypothetical protein
MQNITEKQTAKLHSVEQVPFLLVKNDKLNFQMTWLTPSIISL